MSLVLVTGASGFIAGHVVRVLLERGYRVRGTVRDAQNQARTKALLSLSGAERLELVSADLLNDGSFDAAAQGCDAIIHTASPFIIDSKDPKTELIDPAVRGTQNVLGAALKSSSVKRVVLTSSVVAIYGAPKERGEDHVFDENDWNQSSTIENSPYSLSKRLAEEAAWQIAKSQSNFDLVVINPGFVLGPPISDRHDGESVQIVVKMLTGKFPAVPEIDFAVVDVRDVADAHVNAIEIKEASGRYLCADRAFTLLDIGDALRSRFPNYPLPKFVLPKFVMYILGPLLGMTRSYVSTHIGARLSFSHQKILDDKILPEFRDTAVAIAEMGQFLIDQGIVKKMS